MYLGTTLTRKTLTMPSPLDHMVPGCLLSLPRGSEMIHLKPSENNVPVKSKLQHPPGQPSGYYPGCQRGFFRAAEPRS